MKILYISNFLPYDNIKHAGGKTFNYYYKRVKNIHDNEVAVIGLCNKKELMNINIDSSQKMYPIITKGSLPTLFKRIIFDGFSLFFKKNTYEYTPFKRFNIIDKCKKVKKSGFVPDVIILEWTPSVLLIGSIKKVFPNSKYVASEHDVSYLHSFRDYLLSTDNKKIAMHKKYLEIRKKELHSLLACDLIVPHNEKDSRLLIKDGIPDYKIFALTPFFQNLSTIEKAEKTKDILFWGAMNRQDNYLSAIWFIEKVLPLLNGYGFRFIIAGNKPPKVLTKLSSDQIIVTGFVKNVDQLFAKCMCFASPIVNGAGIKVKNIEALSSGIPVISNEIGIEGIPVVPGEDYFHAESPEQFANAIIYIFKNQKKAQSIGESGKNKVLSAFNLDKSFSSFIKHLKKIVYE